MPLDRRRLLRSVPSLLPSALVASSFPSLWSPARAAGKTRLGAALLVPLTGDHAALGRSMERAAALVQAGSDSAGHTAKPIHVYDTLGTSDGAARAARAAYKAGASIIFGPVFARDVPAVLGAVPPGMPVVTFSNDAALIESGAFLLGLTARQSVAAILGYAAQRGVRRVAITAPVQAERGWGTQVRDAALALAPSLGLDVSPSPFGNGPELPDAVLAINAATLADVATQLSASGIQALGAFQGLDADPAAMSRIEGAWIAAPDPQAFAGFARAYEQRNGSPPGAIAALAYDAAGIAMQLIQGGGTDRSALLATGGFRAVCGNLRFHENGSAARTLAILEAKQGRLRTVATWPG